MQGNKHQVAPGGQPTLVFNIQPVSNIRHQYLGKCVMAFSIVLFPLGLLAIAMQIWNIVNETPFSVGGVGIYGGLFVSSRNSMIWEVTKLHRLCFHAFILYLEIYFLVQIPIRT